MKGKRKQPKDSRPSNVVAFRSKADRETEREMDQGIARLCAWREEQAALVRTHVIQFPVERVRSRGPVFNLPLREGSDGQCSFDFDGLDHRPKAPCEVVQLRPVDSVQQAYSLYIRASQLDEDPATYGDARALYEKALWLDPSLAVAEVNLANIHFRHGDDRRAEAMYRHAISVQYHNPEGHYNLGYVMLERGDARAAAKHFMVAIEQDPRFADAHFNLAMAYEQMGERTAARNHWRAYLSIEPNGTWADIARKHLA